MKKSICLLAFVLCVSARVSAENDNIIMSKVQMYNLGIKLGKPKSVLNIPLLNAPARVVIPPGHEYIVSASQSGLISQLNVAIGDLVEKGQVLATISSPELLTLQRQFLKANSQLGLAWTAFQRDQKMLDEGIISERRWQETRASYEGHASEVNEARQLLQISGMSKSDIDRLSKNRRLSSNLSVGSPIDGVVMDRMATAGERIDILAPLYRIADLRELWLEIHVPQERLKRIKEGDRVEIVNSPVKARVILLGQSVNPENQTVLVRAAIEGQNADVRAGQTVNARIIQTSDQPVFKLPDAAVVQSEGQAYIFSRTAEGFKVKPIDIISRESRNYIISGDLAVDEQIAVRGGVALKARWMGLGSEGEDG